MLNATAGRPEQFTSNNIVFVGGGQVFNDANDPYSGVNPAWRRSYLHHIVARGWALGSDETMVGAVHRDITDVKVGAMRDLAPSTGCYMNEVRTSNLLQLLFLPFVRSLRFHRLISTD